MCILIMLSRCWLYIMLVTSFFFKLLCCSFFNIFFVRIVFSRLLNHFYIVYMWIRAVIFKILIWRISYLLSEQLVTCLLVAFKQQTSLASIFEDWSRVLRVLCLKLDNETIWFLTPELVDKLFTGSFHQPGCFLFAISSNLSLSSDFSPIYVAAVPKCAFSA